MAQSIMIWSPVIVSSLKAPRTFQPVRHYKLGIINKHIRDIKLKTSRIQVEPQGKQVGVRVYMDIAVLLEDADGNTSIFNHPELIRERISGQEFDRPQNVIGDGEYVIQLLNLNWDGDIEAQKLIIRFSCRYMLHVVRPQVVTVFSQAELAPEARQDERSQSAAKAIGVEMPTVISRQPSADIISAEELIRIRNENENLTHKIFRYERDLMSLQRGLKKSEERNSELSRELKGTKATLRQLQDALTRKEITLLQYENIPVTDSGKHVSPAAVDRPDASWGQRLKRMVTSLM